MRPWVCYWCGKHRKKNGANGSSGWISNVVVNKNVGFGFGFSSGLHLYCTLLRQDERTDITRRSRGAATDRLTVVTTEMRMATLVMSTKSLGTD
jgi:hypothetical protein